MSTLNSVAMSWEWPKTGTSAAKRDAANFDGVENNFIVYSLRLDYNLDIFTENKPVHRRDVKGKCNESQRFEVQNIIEQA